MIIATLSFICLGFAVVSLWIRRDPKIWGACFGASFFLGIISGMIEPPGALLLFTWAVLWFYVARSRHVPLWFLLFATIVVVSFAFKLRFFPGFNTIALSQKFHLGLDVPMMEFFPLALLVPLASSRSDWAEALRKGLPLSLMGIGVMAAIAVGVGTVEWHFKLPSSALQRYAVNLFFTSALEEGFFRGFIQNELVRLFSGRKIVALVTTAFIFTVAHVFWSPDLGVQVFVFLAGLLYGGVYMISGRIEGAILCHFLLNFVHMTFFSYHAM